MKPFAWSLLLIMCLSPGAAPIRVLDGESAEGRYYNRDSVAEPYRSRRASYQGKVYYQFQVEPAAKYELRMGFCARPVSWDIPVGNPLDLYIEGDLVRTVDVARDLGAEKPHDLVFPASDINGDGKLDVIVRPNPESVDSVSWISRILLLREGETLADVNCGAEGPGIEMALVYPHRGRSPYNAVLSSGNQWAYFGVNSEVRELWARGRVYGEPPPRYCIASGYLEIEQDRQWRDLRLLRWDYEWIERTNILRMRANGLQLTALSEKDNDLLALHYTLKKPGRYRYSWTVQHQHFDAPVLEQWQHGVIYRNNSLGYVGIAASTPVSVTRAEGDPHRFLLEGSSPDGKVVILVSVAPRSEGLRERLEKARRDNGKRVVAQTRAWHAWLERGAQVVTPDERINRMYERALLNIMGNRFDTGVIIAGSDGWYKHTWIRDGGYTAMALDLAGFHEEAEAFYRYWLRDKGFSYGGENECQQPAIGIVGFLHHYHLTGDRGFLEDTWEYVQHYADYYSGRIVSEGMLGTAEEWICQIPAKTAWPNSEIYAGMRAAARIAELVEHPARATAWQESAEKLRKAIYKQSYDENLQRFRPLSGSFVDSRVDSGMLNVTRLAIFGLAGASASPPAASPTASTFFQIKRVLEQPDYSISRFDANPKGNYPGGQWPVWPISAGWMAQYHTLLGEPDAALNYLRGIARKDRYPYEAALWYLPEQMGLDGRPVSTRNLAWSNGEFITALLQMLAFVRPDAEAGKIHLCPALPTGWDSAEINNLSILGTRLNLSAKRADRRVTFNVEVQKGKPGLLLSLPAHTLPPPEELRVNGNLVEFRTDPAGFRKIEKSWKIEPDSPLVVEIVEAASPPCPIDWGTIVHPGVEGSERWPEASEEVARLRAAMQHLLPLQLESSETSIFFRSTDMPTGAYRIRWEHGVGVVQVGDAPGLARACRRLVREMERYFHENRLAGIRAGNPHLH